MKKILFILMLTAVFVSPAMGLVQHQVSFVDEFGDAVTNITSITVFNSGLATSPTIYSDRAAAITVTNPITTSSTNSTFDQSLGIVRWFQQKPTYKLTVTDGTKVLTLDAQDESNTRFPWFANYIGTAASLSVNDNQSIVVGTDSDMALAWVNASNFMSWIPAVDGSAFNLGTSGTAANVDFNWFVGASLGIKADEGAATLVIDGVTTSINASSNFATNINTGTSTGAVTIGSSTAGALTLDTTSTYTLSSDGAHSTTTTDASADISVDATAGSVIIDGGEAIADAVTIQVPAGGVDITSAATFDIDITATGGKCLIIASEAAADQFKVDTTGTVAGFAQVYETTDGGIQLNADGAANGDITIDAADILTFTSADTKIFDGAAAETWIIEGTADGSEATVVFTDPTADVTWTFPTAATDTFAVMASTLATNAPEIVNSVTGGTNQLIFEGTADGFETIVTATDATADATLTLPDDTGSFGYTPTGTTTSAADSLAIPITHAIVVKTTGADAEALTLADGENGQILTITLGTDGGGTGTLTPTTTTGFSTIAFADAGDTATLLYSDDAVGWILIGCYGLTAQPTVAQ